MAAGVITASLILASALMMHIDAGPRLLGYPAIALLLFLVAAGLGVTLVLSARFKDRKAEPRQERGPG